jgi:uncharacterized protein with HEPN domain
MYLWDMQQAASHIVHFTAGRELDEYLADVMLRSAVERQFEIIGEALAQLTKLDPALAARISEHQGIIGFRNVLIHGYAMIDDKTVWQTIETKLPILLRELDDLLNEP